LKRGFQERTLLGISLTHYKPRAHHAFKTPEIGDLSGDGKLDPARFSGGTSARNLSAIAFSRSSG
jgi:hypothetical protein